MNSEWVSTYHKNVKKCHFRIIPKFIERNYGYFFKHTATLHRSSFDVINILSIFSHGISFKKKSLATGGGGGGTWTCVADISQQPCFWGIGWSIVDLTWYIKLDYILKRFFFVSRIWDFYSTTIQPVFHFNELYHTIKIYNKNMPRPPPPSLLTLQFEYSNYSFKTFSICRTS